MKRTQKEWETKFPLLTYKIKFTPIFAWFDLWVGFFWDRKHKWLYILPLPCCGVIIKIDRKIDITLKKPEDRDPKEICMELARLVHTKFKNWCTPEQVWDKFKKELNNVQYTTSILQTLVFYKLAVTKQELNSRPQFKITLGSDVREYEIKKTITVYQQTIASLEKELQTIKK